MKAFPLWIKPVGPSNQRSRLWPLKQLSRVEEGRSNPVCGRVSDPALCRAGGQLHPSWMPSPLPFPDWVPRCIWASGPCWLQLYRYNSCCEL